MEKKETKFVGERDIDPEANVREDGGGMPTHDGIGIAFSGGGIRSAAFSSGVLRHLLQKKVPIDYMSCVSGGGYTGTAYVEWKYRHGGVDDPEWHEKFFNQMRENANAECNWRSPLSGCINTLGVLTLVVAVVFVIPALIWIPLAFPLAYLVNFCFGDMLRSGFICKGDPLFNTTTIAPKYRKNALHLNCFQTKERNVDSQFIFYFAILIGIAVCFGLRKGVGTQLQHFFRLATSVLAIILAFTFLPWYFEVYLTLVPNWIRILALILGVLLWMGIPHLRASAAWSLLFFLYSYVIKLNVYRHAVLGIAYSDEMFDILTWSCTGIYLFAPLFRISQQSSIRGFYRYKLQNAFYAQPTRFPVITWSDFFPIMSPNKHSKYEEIDGRNPEKDILTLEDLQNIKPSYVCNVMVNNWTYAGCTDPRKAYTILTISPHLIERIDDDTRNDFGESSIGPADIRLSDAMATSGAVIAYSMGDYHNKAAFSAQMMFGVSMGSTLVSDKKLLKKGVLGMLTPILMQILIFLPLLLMPLVELHLAPIQVGYALIGIFITFAAFCFVMALLPTGKSRKSKVEKFTRWCIVNVYLIRYIREVLQINNVGEVPPAIMYLSDGGHVENLGLLSLLKLRMKRIIVADGGFKSSKEEAGVDLLHSLNMAREKLRCSFSGMDGRDINEDLRDNFVEAKYNRVPRHFQFKVHYFDKDLHTGISRKVKEGVILLLAPRHPSDGILGQQQADWTEYEEDTGLKLERERWGDGPYLVEEEVDRLTGACCVCCHCACCKGCSEAVLGRFPHHSTANQFFTPDQFSAYHREGYRSLIEGSLDEFLKAK